MNPVDIIAKKRDALSLSSEEIRYFIERFLSNEITDYQMAAFLMAVRIKGMTREECSALTAAMLESGDRFSWSDLKEPVVDKHSTGGVGDKVSIILAPLAAATGLKVPMISGRGLAHSGGTLDKLESIPGFQTRLSPSRLKSQLDSLGMFMMGQTENIAPADRRMYALRDVTGTVESIPLITSSILSKKLAAGLDGLVMDVKVGSGSFMKNIDEAKSLAENLVAVGEEMGLKTAALLSDMDEPLGWTIGNRPEIEESIDLLDPSRDSSHLIDLEELVIELNAMMLITGSITGDIADARSQSRSSLEDGSAWEVFKDLVQAQEGDIESFNNTDPQILLEYRAERDTFITRVDALALGRAALFAGAGRTTAEQTVDPNAGIRLRKKSGQFVKKNEVLATVYSKKKDASASVLECLESGFQMAEDAESQNYAKSPLLIGKIDSDGWTEM